MWYRKLCMSDVYLLQLVCRRVESVGSDLDSDREMDLSDTDTPASFHHAQVRK